MGLTTDKADQRLGHGIDNEPVPQNEVYLVLSEEERKKGLVRPLRNSYTHVGKSLSYYKGVHRMLTKEEIDENPKYVAVMTTLTNEDGSFLGCPYVTHEEFDSWFTNKRVGGCGYTTKMGYELAETYARDPKFYGSTYCVHCQKHLMVDEFVWEGTDINVGD